MSEVVRLNDAEVRYDASARRLPVLLDVQWVLRVGTTNLVQRGYTGKLYYTTDYQRSAQGQVLLGTLTREAYSLAPLNGLLAYTLGWTEVPLLLQRDDEIAAEIRRRLMESPALRDLP
jgi:hypothetical protein